MQQFAQPAHALGRLAAALPAGAAAAQSVKVWSEVWDLAPPVPKEVAVSWAGPNSDLGPGPIDVEVTADRAPEHWETSQ